METLDKIDKKIIYALMHDSRKSFSDMAKDFGVGISTVHRRVKRLVNEDVIKGFTALVDNEKIGLNATAFVGINCDNEYKGKVLKELLKIDKVVDVYDVLEPYDVFIKVQGQDLNTLKEAVFDKIFKLDGVADIKTVLVLKTMRENCHPNGRGDD